MKLSNFPNLKSNANKYAIDLYFISTSGIGGEIMRCIDIPRVHYSIIQCVFLSLIHIEKKIHMNEVMELGILV